jgi:hypothetical protein
MKNNDNLEKLKKELDDSAEKQAPSASEAAEEPAAE